MTRGGEGQMAVELAALLPVVVVMAYTLLNLLSFVSACAVFDRVCLDAVVSQGVSPSGEQGDVLASAAVARCVEDALARPSTCSVEVSASRVSEGEGGTDLTLAPFLTRFTCTLVFRPWPRAFSIAGVSYEAPLALRHERTLVVDRYRTGVVV